MKVQNHWFPTRGHPLTIWSRGSAELIPERFRRIITVVMPVLYTLFTFFGVSASIIPVPTFKMVVGVEYGVLWATCVAITAAASLLGLIFRSRLEIYTSIALAILLTIYAVYIMYIVFNDTISQDVTRLAVIFGVLVYPVMPAWRSLDIIFEIRKSRKRQLYVQRVMGEKNAK